jgi:hypothetical protein
MLLEMYLEKTRGQNKFGSFITTAGKVLDKASIPSSPYLTAADTFLKFANDTIQNDTKETGAKLFANITLQFADRDKEIQTCRDARNAETGAIGILAATGSKGPNFLELGNLDKKYCWRYNLGSTAEIEYAKQPSGGCGAVADTEWNEPSNDYVMLFLSADVMLSAQPKTGTHGLSDVDVLKLASRHVDDVSNARALCDSLKASRNLCGVN